MSIGFEIFQLLWRLEVGVRVVKVAQVLGWCDHVMEWNWRQRCEGFGAVLSWNLFESRTLGWFEI